MLRIFVLSRRWTTYIPESFNCILTDSGKSKKSDDISVGRPSKTKRKTDPVYTSYLTELASLLQTEATK